VLLLRPSLLWHFRGIVRRQHGPGPGGGREAESTPQKMLPSS
jgi:hypothetical protein